jgi:ribosomal protein S18 acetylase RimI-like enzyme
MKVRRATNADILFLVEAITEAEASGSQQISYREIFALNDRELKDLLTSILAEEIQGCGWSPREFLIAEQDREAAACCAAWIEAASGLSSSIIKSQLLIEFLGQEKWGTSKDNLAAAAEINIERTPGVLQIESVYTQHGYRGSGLSGTLIREHLSQAAKSGTRSAEIQLMKNNGAAIKAYQKAGFTLQSEKGSDNPKLGKLLPYHTKLLMVRDFPGSTECG